jgi:hypothetical protein
MSASDSAFSESERASRLGKCKDGEGIRIRVTLFVIFHNDWSRDSSFSLHCSFLPFFSQYRPLEAIDLDIRTGVPRDLPLPAQPVGTGSTLGSTSPYGLLDDDGQLLDALIECLLVVHCGIPRESVFEASLESEPVHSREIGAVQQPLIRLSTHGVGQDR